MKLPDWHQESFFRSPFGYVNTTPNGLNSYPKMFTQVRHASSHSLYCKYAVIAFVSALLVPCFPANISGRVIPVVVNSAKCHVGWWQTKVRKEVLEFHPTSANCNPSSSVMLKGFLVWVRASVKHITPCSINSAFTQAVLKGCQFYSFTPQASTGLCMFRPEFRKSHRNFITTLAKAEHLSDEASTFCDFGWRFLNYFQSSKSPANDRYSFRHTIASFNVVFSGERPATTGARCDYIKLALGGKV